ncbi:MULTISPECIES: hypothetical protein [unclassified Frankia]|uniref:hypothetical protein n=1 Tax=unclassified Frankia TaxID=2632575 RepID=UPI002AD230FB|nr:MULTISPECIES: hypothetical protein [unclassified Frankia]
MLFWLYGVRAWVRTLEHPDNRRAPTLRAGAATAYCVPPRARLWGIRDDIHEAFRTLGCAITRWRRLKTSLC